MIYLSQVGYIWATCIILNHPPTHHSLKSGGAEISKYVSSVGLEVALEIIMLGRCVAILHLLRVTPRFRKVLRVLLPKGLIYVPSIHTISFFRFYILAMLLFRALSPW